MAVFMRVAEGVRVVVFMVAGYLARRVAGWWMRDEGGIFSEAG